MSVKPSGGAAGGANQAALPKDSQSGSDRRNGSRRKRFTRSALGWLVTAGLVAAVIGGFNYVGIGSQVVMTSSMTPAILAGDAVITVGPRLHQAEIGDVVVYQVRWGSDELPAISHRIVASKGPGVWTTKGDNNPGADPWPVPQDRISGVVIVHVPLHYFRDSRIAGATLGAIAAVVVMVLFFPRRRRAEGARPEAPTAHEFHQ